MPWSLLPSDLNCGTIVPSGNLRGLNSGSRRNIRDMGRGTYLCEGSKATNKLGKELCKSLHWPATAWRNKEIKSTNKNEERSSQSSSEIPHLSEASEAKLLRSGLTEATSGRTADGNASIGRQLLTFPQKENQERQVFKTQSARGKVWRCWDLPCVHHLKAVISQRSGFALPPTGHDHFCSEQSLHSVKSHGIQGSCLQILLGSSWTNTYFLAQRCPRAQLLRLPKSIASPDIDTF